MLCGTRDGFLYWLRMKDLTTYSFSPYSLKIYTTELTPGCGAEPER